MLLDRRRTTSPDLVKAGREADLVRTASQNGHSSNSGPLPTAQIIPRLEQDDSDLVLDPDVGP